MDRPLEDPSTQDRVEDDHRAVHHLIDVKSEIKATRESQQQEDKKRRREEGRKRR